MKKILSLLVLLSAMATTPAFAGVIQSDMFTVYDPTGAIAYQFGVTEDGTPLGGAQCIRNDFQACDPGEQGYDGSDYLTVSWWYLPVTGLAAPRQFGNATQLVEANGTISDWFGIIQLTPGATEYYLAFASDGEAYGLPDFYSINIDEPDPYAPVDATMYLPNTLRNNGWTAEFLSADIDLPTPAPLALLGLGMVGMGFIRRKRAC